MILKELLDGEAISTYSDQELEQMLQKIVKDKVQNNIDPDSGLSIQMINNELSRRKTQREQDASDKTAVIR